MACVDNPPSEKCIPMDDGAKIYTKVEGKDDGDPIVLVHGYALTHQMWDKQVPYLTQRGYKVVTLDLRGFGQSDKPKQPNPQAKYDYDRWARDLDTVITALKLRDIRLVGYSMGGGVTMYYASTTPNPPIKKLTLLAATGPWMTRTDDHPAGWPADDYSITIGIIKIGQLWKNPTQYEAAFQMLTGISYLNLDTQIMQWIAGMVHSASPQGLIGGLEQFRDQNLTPRLANIHTQVKICHGTYDIFVDQGVRDEQVRYIAGAMSFDFDRSGHGLFIEQEQKTSQEIDW